MFLFDNLLVVKATLLQRGLVPNQSFISAKHDFAHFLKIWHYHAELELVYIEESEGTRFIGDNIERFHKGELILIGSNLPHMFQNDASYFETDSKLRAKAEVIHFSSELLLSCLAHIPELASLQGLIERAKLGLTFSAPTSKKVKELIFQLGSLNKLDRLLHFFNILSELIKDEHATTIASPGFVNHFDRVSDSKLDKVYDHVMHHFQQNIDVEQMAALVSMNKSSFCRYFKKATQKTFTEFLNEVRIGFACKMLLERQMNILEVSYHCGYNNISHFNRQFLKKMGMAPSAYLKHRVKD